MANKDGITSFQIIKIKDKIAKTEFEISDPKTNQNITFFGEFG